MADYDVIDIQAKIAIDIDHVFNILESGSFKANPPPPLMTHLLKVKVMVCSLVADKVTLC